MERVVYYTIHASAEENQNGTFHFSKPYSSQKKALADAKKIKDDFVAVEKHHEIWDRYEWRPNYDLGESWMEVIHI